MKKTSQRSSRFGSNSVCVQLLLMFVLLPLLIIPVPNIPSHLCVLHCFQQKSFSYFSLITSYIVFDLARTPFHFERQ